jgi:hypothetical protein
VHARAQDLDERVRGVRSNGFQDLLHLVAERALRLGVQRHHGRSCVHRVRVRARTRGSARTHARPMHAGALSANASAGTMQPAGGA